MSDYYYYNNKPVSQERIATAAANLGLSVDDYIKKHNIKTSMLSNKEIETKAEEMHVNVWDRLKDGLSGIAYAVDPFTPDKGFDYPAERRRKDEAIRTSNEDFKIQKADFERELDKAFSENPTLFGDLIKNNEKISLQDRDIDAGDFGNPEEYLKELLKQKMGGFGLWGGDRKAVESKELGMTMYSKLTNEDLDEILIGKFDTKLYEEKTNIVNQRSAAEINAQKAAGVSEQQYFSKKRNADINSFAGDDKNLANLIEEYNHGNLDESVKEQKWNEILEAKKKLKKTHMLIDLTTGNLIFANDEESAEAKQNENTAILDIWSRQKEYQYTSYDVLQQDYRRSATALAQLHKEMSEMVAFDTEGYDYTDDYISRPMTIKAYMNAYEGGLAIRPSNWVPKGYTEDEWTRKLGRYKEDLKEYTLDHEAIKRMYLLNEGLQDVKMGFLDHVEVSTKSLVKPFVGSHTAEKLLGSTERDVLDEVGSKYNELGFEMSDDDKEYLDRHWGEQVNEGFFGSGRMLAEFYTINKFLKPVQAVTGFNKMMAYLNSARWVKNGKTFTEVGMRSKVAAKKGKDVAAVTADDVSNYALSLGMRQKTGVGLNNIASTIITGGLEGLKFEAITRFDTGGEQSGFSTGFGFGVAGRMMAPLAPFLARKGYLRDIDLKPIHLNSRALFERFVTQPASFVVGSEAGELTNAIVDDALGNKELQLYMDEHYKDYGTIGIRLLVNHAIGYGFGFGSFKGFESMKNKYSSKVAIESNIRTAEKKMQELGRLAGVTDKMISQPETYIKDGKKVEVNRGFWSDKVQDQIQKGLSDKNLGEYYKHWEVYTAMRGRLKALHRAEGYMDPTRAEEMITAEMRNEIANARKDGVSIRVEVVNNNALKKGQEKMENPDGSRIDADVISKDGGKTKIYRFNAETYTPDVRAHEVGHDWFQRKFGNDAVFKSEFNTTLGNVAKKIQLNRFITEKEAVQLGNETLAGKKMNLYQSLRLEKFDPLSPQNNVRIEQWEMFSHIAQRLGNKTNYYDVTGTNGFGELRTLISSFGKRTGQKYNLSREADVVRWFRDYAKSIRKGKDHTVLFKELERVIDTEASLVQKHLMALEGRTGPDTYQTKPLDLGGGYKINNPAELARKTQSAYEKAMAEGKSKKQFFREMLKPGVEGSNYPVLGDKIGPMLDMALSSWNSKWTKGAEGSLHVDLGNRSWEGKRSEIAMDFLAPKSRKGGLESIFEKYEPIDNRKTIKNQEGVEVNNPRYGKPQKLQTWVVGRLRNRMQETIDAGIKEKLIGDKLGEYGTANVGAGLDKTPPSPAAKPKGIQLRNYQFNFSGRKRTINPQSTANIEKASLDVFNNTKIGDFTYQKVAEKMLDVTTPEMTKLFGGIEGMTPKKLYEAQIGFIKENARILYDAMPLTSHPKFYENTMLGRSILKKFYKNTGKKYITEELSVEEAARTNARAFKWEKLPATKERVQELVDLMSSGRDAGVRNNKINILKEHVGKVLGNQVFRDVISNPEFRKNLNKEGLSKLEGLNAELAIRKLRGAVPEKLQSKDLETMERFVKEWKGLDHGKLLLPGVHLRTMIENDVAYKKLFGEKLNMIDNLAKEMGYELKDLSLKTWQRYAEANRRLENQFTEAVIPETFNGWAGFGKYLKENKLIDKALDPNNLLNIGERSWYKNYNSVKGFDNLVNWLKNNMHSAFFDSQLTKKSVGIGSDLPFATKEGFAKRNNPYWFDLMKGVKDSGKKIPKELEFKIDGKKYNALDHYKTTNNATFKKNLNTELGKWYGNPKTADLKINPKTQKAFAEHINKKYLIRKGSSFEKMEKANQKVQEYFYGKLFDYYQSSKNKVEALNNIFKLLQMQTSIGDGFTRSLATHNAITLNFVRDWRGDIKKEGKIVEPTTKSHSEHEFQAFNFNANFMLNMIKNSGNKAMFLENFKPLSKAFKQSIIDRSVQNKYDSLAEGGKIGLPKGWTTEISKYSFMREMQIAENTLDLRTGKTFDRLISEKIGADQVLKTVESNMILLKKAGLQSKNLSRTEQIEALKNLEKAIAEGRKSNKDKRGISVWDFDDTLAKTKSGVRARIPNIDGLPKPGRKVIFLAGGAGSGKSNVVKKLGLEKDGFKIVNSDISLEWLKKNHGLPENMNDLTKEQLSKLGKLQWEARKIAARKQMKFQGKGDGIVVDGTGGSMKVMEKQVAEFKAKGYDVQMLFVETSLETALARNKARKERSLKDIIVRKNHEAVQGNKEGFKKLFENNFAEIKTDKLTLKDPMPIELVNKLAEFTKGYEKRRLTAEEFAVEGKEILDRGGKFDFSEFNVVTEGTKGPFFPKAMARAKKYGTKDQFILTARPPESAPHIKEFLKQQGLDIPLENITGLGNSTAEAKALWMTRKFAEGYNDFYFADDAIANIKEVKNVLQQLDVKYKVQQALQAKNLDKGFNEILEQSIGVESYKTYSTAKAIELGKKKKATFFGSPGAEDFMGLTTYSFSGKGKLGEKHKKFFEDNLQKPFNRAYLDIHNMKQSISNDYKALRKQIPEVTNKLNQRIGESVYTYDQAIRVHRWNRAGFEIPGLGKKDLKKLVETIERDPALRSFSNELGIITKRSEGWIPPREHWLGENILADLNNVVNRHYRKDALAEFMQNREAIFGKWEGGRLVGKNMNKIEAHFGAKHREALENMLWRMEKGTNRAHGTNSVTNAWMNWVNNATGTIMFFNQKSAALQTISSINYINGKENNPFAAAKAFANQPQYWRDYATIWNSNMMRQRRSGLKINLEASEMVGRLSTSGNKVQKLLAYLLEKGFIPTKYADSFAICAGGATYYRNRINMYKKQGLKKAEATRKAWEDFVEITEYTQQSSRPDLISMQQASAIGRPILAFANTPMQMFRRHKRRLQDIANNRGDMKENVMSSIYYGFVQTMIFSYLANALWAVDDDSDPIFEEKKKSRHIHTILDSYLRGMGTSGAAVSALKNGIVRFSQENEKDYNADYGNVVIDMLNVSPPIGSKARKLYSAGKTYKYNKDVIGEMGLSLDNPATLAVANTVSALTNFPVDRAVMKAQNIKDASNSDYENWQRIALLWGFNRWTMGLENKVLEDTKERAKKRKKKDKKFKPKSFKKKFKPKTFTPK